MNASWLATTAVALVIGIGAVVAQSQTDQKREETPRAQQKPSKNEIGRSEGRQDRNTEAQKGAKERGESGASGDRKQAEDQQPRDTKQPTQQSRDQKDRDGRPATARGQGQNDRPGATPTKQSQDQQKGPDTKQQAEPKQQGQKQQDQTQDRKQRGDQKQEQTGQTQQQNQDNRARDAKQPGDQNQQTGQQQPAQQPSTRATQQGTRPGDTKTGPTRDRNTTESSRTSTSASVNINDRQRTEVIKRLRRDRSASSSNINIDVSVGVRLPSRARVRPLPQDIVRIMPQYRGYQYTVIEDEIVVVEPRTRKVVEVIREPGSSASVYHTSRSGSTRISISSEQRETLKQSARRMTTAPTSGGSGTLSDTSCLQLQAIPEELARSNPELSSYRMLAIGEQIVLVDPREQKIVEVIE